MGQWLRKRYNQFLSEMYSPKEIYAYSPDFTRCLTSITASLAGLYPPKGHQIWNVGLLWRPIPVHSTKIETDEIYTLNRDCPKYHKLYDNAMKTQSSLLQNKYINFFELIGKKAGFSKVDLNSLSTVKYTFNTYISYNSLFLPEWYEEVDQNFLDYLVGMYLRFS